MGVVLALMNALSTWNITRVCRRIKRGRIDSDNVLRAWRKYFRLSVTLSFVGLLLTLFGAEQIVGTLASKVLSTQGLQVVLGGMSPQSSLQAVDIFLVQVPSPNNSTHRPLTAVSLLHIYAYSVVILSAPNTHLCSHHILSSSLLLLSCPRNIHPHTYIHMYPPP